MRLPLFIVTLLITSPHSASAQSNIVGQLDQTHPAGNSVWVPPFVAEDTFSGRIESITLDADESLITLNTDSLPSLNGHYLEIGEGAEAGLTLNINAGTNNTVSVVGDAASFGLAVGQKIVIREHLTVEALLPEGADFVPFVDTVSVFNTDGSRLDAFWNPISGNWEDVFQTNLNDTVILPGQGVLLFLSQELTVHLGGEGSFTHVKTTPTRILARQGAVNLVGQVNPFPHDHLAPDIGFIEDFTPFEDSVRFFSLDGTFTPVGTFLSDGGLTTPGSLTFFDSGNSEVDPSTFNVLNNEAAVVSVNLDKTIGLAAPQIGAFAP